MRILILCLFGLYRRYGLQSTCRRRLSVSCVRPGVRRWRKYSTARFTTPCPLTGCCPNPQNAMGLLRGEVGHHPPRGSITATGLPSLPEATLSETFVQAMLASMNVSRGRNLLPRMPSRRTCQPSTPASAPSSRASSSP